ncbi:hypothetical protein INT80_05375 [Gallibacterium anatis]|uniref:Uncharacterized protein n=1 Tax=Gallibacterium anatis TaxID=750 RepID=A0A930Y4Z6_9PAST|nr:hypothetical protein [Gallibacterium anatis]
MMLAEIPWVRLGVGLPTTLLPMTLVIVSSSCTGEYWNAVIVIFVRDEFRSSG